MWTCWEKVLARQQWVTEGPGHLSVEPTGALWLCSHLLLGVPLPKQPWGSLSCDWWVAQRSRQRPPRNCQHSVEFPATDGMALLQHHGVCTADLPLGPPQRALRVSPNPSRSLSGMAQAGPRCTAWPGYRGFPDRPHWRPACRSVKGDCGRPGVRMWTQGA